jgi:hypothetical protein
MPSIGPKFDPELNGPQLEPELNGPQFDPELNGLKLELELELELEPHGIQESIKLSPPLLVLLSHGIHGDALAMLEANKVIVNIVFVMLFISYSPK